MNNKELIEYLKQALYLVKDIRVESFIIFLLSWDKSSFYFSSVCTLNLRKIEKIEAHKLLNFRIMYYNKVLSDKYFLKYNPIHYKCENDTITINFIYQDTDISFKLIYNVLNTIQEMLDLNYSFAVLGELSEKYNITTLDIDELKFACINSDEVPNIIYSILQVKHRKYGEINFAVDYDAKYTRYLDSNLSLIYSLTLRFPFFFNSFYNNTENFNFRDNTFNCTSKIPCEIQDKTIKETFQNIFFKFPSIFFTNLYGTNKSKSL